MIRSLPLLLALGACVGDVGDKDASSLTTDLTDSTDLPTDTDVALPAALRIPAGTLAWFDEPCPDGWSDWEPAKGRTLVGVLDGGHVGHVVGEPLTSVLLPAHTHGVSLDVNVPDVGIAGISGCCNSGPGDAGTYAAAVAPSATTSTLPILALYACHYDGADDPEAAGTPFPAGSIVHFDRPSCPTGWAPYTTGAGRAFAGVPFDGWAELNVGQPLGDAEVRTHTHTLTGQVTVPSYSLAAATGGNHDPARKGTYAFTVTSEPMPVDLPYSQALTCEATGETPSVGGPDDPLPSWMILWSKELGCPEGWSEYSPLEGRFPVGVNGAMVPLDSSGAPLARDEDRVHTHQVDGTLTVPSRSVALASGCCLDSVGGNGTFAITGQMGEESTGFPWTALHACVH